MMWRYFSQWYLCMDYRESSRTWHHSTSAWAVFFQTCFYHVWSPFKRTIQKYPSAGLPGFKSLQICPHGSYTYITSVRYTVSNPVDSMSETIDFLWIFRPSCRLSSASRKTKKMSQLSSLWATQDVLLLSCSVAGAKHGSRQLLGLKQVHVWLFLGELYLELFESSFPARDPSFSRVGFALKTKKPVNTGVFKYMAKPAKGRTSTRLLQVDHDQRWPWSTNGPPTI